MISSDSLREPGEVPRIQILPIEVIWTLPEAVIGDDVACGSRI